MSNIIAISNSLYNNTSLLDKRGVVYIKNKEDLTYDILHKLEPRYVFFPHWSYIIPEEIHSNFNCIIFHMTDLPFGRGGSPLQNLIARGIYETKISAIQCVSDLDAGSVYLKRPFSLKEGSAFELYIKAGEIVSEMIDEIIATSPIPQEQVGEPVIFKRRRVEESNIDEIRNIHKLHDYIRMLDAPGYPQAFIINNNLRFSFSESKLSNGKITAKVKIEEI